MKYNYAEYPFPLCDGMKNVQEAYAKYKQNENDNNAYWALKEAIYGLSLDVKSARVCRQFPNDVLDEINEYYWGLLL